MKKALGLLILPLLLITGCGTDMASTPTKEVEKFLSSYQTLEQKVLDDLDDVVKEEELFNTEEREKYRDLMKKHYQDLTYEIKDERVDGDEATVTAEVTVTDYSKIMRDAEKYRDEHKEEFQDENGEDSDVKFIDYRLEKMKEAKEKVKYTIDFHVHKEDGKWQLEDLSDTDFDKIHGIYNY